MNTGCFTVVKCQIAERTHYPKRIQPRSPELEYLQTVYGRKLLHALIRFDIRVVSLIIVVDTEPVRTEINETRCACEIRMPPQRPFSENCDLDIVP